jgi:hypothetical protein
MCCPQNHFLRLDRGTRVSSAASQDKPGQVPLIDALQGMAKQDVRGYLVNAEMAVLAYLTFVRVDL